MRGLVLIYLKQTQPNGVHICDVLELFNTGLQGS